jgi:preprotein translocase subunit SecD
VAPDHETGQPEISIEFDRTGAKIFEKVTAEHVRERLAIILDDEVMSAPLIQSRITGGKARITLGAMRSYDEALNEAHDLAVALRSGAIPTPIRIVEERVVAPPR